VITTHEPCGCIKTEKPGYIHTKLCVEHRASNFIDLRLTRAEQAAVLAAFVRPTDNSDLI